MPGSSVTVLDLVDLRATLADEEYHQTLRQWQRRLGKLAWALREKGRAWRDLGVADGQGPA